MTDDSPEIAGLKELAARANAERDLAKAQLEEVQAKQKLADAKTGADVAAQAAAKSQAEAQTAVYAQQKAAAEAQEAAVNAELTALKAKFGTVTGSSVTGTVTTDAGAGNGEASLLAAQAVAAAAQQITADLPCEKHYIVFAGTQRPNLDHWRAFQVQTQLVKEAFETADKAKSDADNAAEGNGLKALPRAQVDAGTESVATALTGAGAILDLGSKLGSYFQSDYKLGPATVTGSDDDLLALSVVGALRAPASGAPRAKEVWFPARWIPQAGDDAVSKLLNQSMRTGSIGKLRDVQQASERSTAAADKETDPAKKAPLEEVAALYGRAADAYMAAQKRFDDLLVSLATVDKNGLPQVTLIVDQMTLAKALADGAYALLVRLNTSAGGYYTKKNLWTFLGCMPFFVSGGAIASYVAVDGASGSVKCAGQFQIHSGYHKLHKVEKKFLMRSSTRTGADGV